MSLASMKKGFLRMEETLVASFQTALDDCRASNESFVQSFAGDRNAKAFCGIAPWAFASAQRVQSLGVIAAERREEGFRFNPDDATPAESRESGRRRTRLVEAGGPDGTTRQELDLLNGLC